MEPAIQPLADAIYADKVRRARAAPPNQKMGWGPELFHEACERMAMGIRAQVPHFTPAEVQDQLRRRLARLREVQEHGIYRPATWQP
ncbi:MAG TPA: hypothetical protein VD994_07430 [Prosthecobacter sp.]|nr:hypothetical protein [Prosthecobacter sp.]